MVTTGRIYVKCNREKNLHTVCMEELIRQVACSGKCYKGKALARYENGKIKVCEGITKRYIAHEATRFINTIKETYSDTNMASFVSKNQINMMIRVCNGSGKYLSCYSLIILHTIYEIIKSECTDYDILRKLGEAIHLYAERALLCKKQNEQDEQDELAIFLADCYLPIEKELNSKIVSCAYDFPNVRKWYPKE